MNHDNQTKLETDVALIRQTVERMDMRLFGNGQKGEISGMKARILHLENWRYWVVGIAVGVGSLMALVFSFVRLGSR